MKRRLSLIVLAASLGFIGFMPARAQMFTPANPGIIAPQSSAKIITLPTVSIGTTATLMDAAPSTGRRSYLHISNPAPPGGPAFGCTTDGSTPVLYAGGTLTLQPGQYYTEEGSFVESGPINCIASAGASAITVKVLDQ